MMKLHIPNPCREDWNQMLPEEQGRHCRICCKTVVDFTSWEPEAISNYIMQRKEERICGHFNANQLYNTVKLKALNWPALIAVSGLSFLRKVAALIVVVFGFAASSCNNNTIDGEPLMVDTMKLEAPVHAEDTLKGKVIPPEVKTRDCEKRADAARHRTGNKHTEALQ